MFKKQVDRLIQKQFTQKVFAKQIVELQWFQIEGLGRQAGGVEMGLVGKWELGFLRGGKG